MNDSKKMKEVWKWKEAVYQKTKKMTREERISFFNSGLKDFIRRTGFKKITEKRG